MTVAPVEAPEPFQFPPLREGRRLRFLGRLRLIPISIPTPARGATPHKFRFGNASGISIPTPARGATGAVDADGRDGRYFNSHPCARGDPAGSTASASLCDFNSHPCARGDYRFLQSEKVIIISIPTPARGATGGGRGCFCAGNHFNSHPCARGDSAVLISHPCDVISIPTPARGATGSRGGYI